jgi:hypothetical protein
MLVDLFVDLFVDLRVGPPDVPPLGLGRGR